MATHQAPRRDSRGRTGAPRPAPATTIRVRVVDDHELFSLGLRACLAEDASLEFVDAPDEEVDVAVVSAEVAAQTRFSCPLVVCGDPTGSAEGNRILAVLRRSTLTSGQLLASVHAAAAGLQVIPPDARSVATTTLDARAMDVLRLLAAGSDTKQIALRLGYSERTIKTVIHEVQRALGSRSRAQAVAEAIRLGLI
jgi:DNA-binding NarL/FixJ family response regulator